MAARPPNKKQRQSLNLMMLSVSAFFLLLVVLGKQMNRAQEPAEKQVDVAPGQIVKLDFGHAQIIRQGETWHYLRPVVGDNAKEIAENWQRLLLSRGRPISNDLVTGQTVLLYIKGLSQPMIAKVSSDDSGMTITFEASAQQFEVTATNYSGYMPRSQ